MDFNPTAESCLLDLLVMAMMTTTTIAIAAIPSNPIRSSGAEAVVPVGDDDDEVDCTVDVEVEFAEAASWDSEDVPEAAPR